MDSYHTADDINSNVDEELAHRQYQEAYRRKILELNNEFLETHRQMLVNNHYAQQYKAALKEIASLLGWVQDNNPNCIGPPPDDCDEIALRLVRERLANNEQAKRRMDRPCSYWAATDAMKHRIVKEDILAVILLVIFVVVVVIMIAVGNYAGPPPEDFDEITLRLAREKLSPN